MTTYKIYQDNQLKAEFKQQYGDFEPFKYLLRSQSQSVNYALKYGGWKVEEIDESTNETIYWNPYDIFGK